MPDWLEITARLAAAALVGGSIGLNRHLHHKAVGLRTLSLVSCGAAGLVLASLHSAGTTPHVDAMSRVIQGIMTGVGFIGAGVIMRGQTDVKVHGLTTAAAVWITAALGVLCGEKPDDRLPDSKPHRDRQGSRGSTGWLSQVCLIQAWSGSSQISQRRSPGPAITLR